MTSDAFSLDRFVEAQADAYEEALAELEAEQKQSYWMWFIFPQLRDLGKSDTAEYYGVARLDEARAYLQHLVLGERLIPDEHTLSFLKQQK